MTATNGRATAARSDRNSQEDIPCCWCRSVADVPDGRPQENVTLCRDARQHLWLTHLTVRAYNPSQLAFGTYRDMHMHAACICIGVRTYCLRTHLHWLSNSPKTSSPDILQRQYIETKVLSRNRYKLKSNEHVNIIGVFDTTTHVCHTYYCREEKELQIQ